MFIHKHNQEPNIDYKLAVNEFADLSFGEFKGSKFGYSAATASKVGEHHLGFHVISNEELPKSVDWSHLGAVTNVKNQAKCGSCYSFSATGAMEGRYEIATGKLLLLSEQQIVDCSRKEGNMGCDGGLMDNVFTYVEKNGLCSEEGYPYTAEVGKCKADECTPAIHPKDIVGIIDVPANNDRAMMEAVAKGPVSVAIEADKTVFQFYSDGVLTAACGDKLDHGVLLVGYGSLDGTDYWKVKNSWSSRILTTTSR
ncbi:MAG: KDEL-tailed cysteine endopeptidase [Chlamydiales bacterium]|jgi:KDEL-tailed cysteine endopeptidase